MKDTILHIRVSENLKNDLQNLGFIKNETVSNIIRDAIQQYIDNPISDEVNKTNENLEPNLVQTLGFAEFIFWVYNKRICPEVNEINELYIQFIELIDEMKNNPLFNNEILKEFTIISNELKELLYGNDDYAYEFKFPKQFNYDNLAYFMYTIRYNEKQDKVIFFK